MRQAGRPSDMCRSQVFQTAIHVLLAALAGPRVALEVEPAQVVLEVLEAGRTEVRTSAGSGSGHSREDAVRHKLPKYRPGSARVSKS